MGHRMAVNDVFDGSSRPFGFENAFAAARKGADIRGCNMLEMGCWVVSRLLEMRSLVQARHVMLSSPCDST